jgi:hypothetical protein
MPFGPVLESTAIMLRTDRAEHYIFVKNLERVSPKPFAMISKLTAETVLFPCSTSAKQLLSSPNRSAI